MGMKHLILVSVSSDNHNEDLMACPCGLQLRRSVFKKGQSCPSCLRPVKVA